jgi:hypothetical protein
MAWLIRLVCRRTVPIGAFVKVSSIVCPDMSAKDTEREPTVVRSKAQAG